MEGEADWWTTSGNIGLPPLARVMGVDVGGYCGLSESGLCVFSKLCPVYFLVVCKSLLVLLYSVVMYVDCGDDG